MKKRRALLISLVATLGGCGYLVWAQGTIPFNSASAALHLHSLPSDAEIRAYLIDHIDVQHEGTGIVVGITTPERRRIVSYGKMNQSDPRAPDGETIFEIGSVTKIFTALLLADMVQHGEVSLTDPVSKYLPPNVEVPEQNGRQITLVDLATHTSGLPFVPSDLNPFEPSSYANYTENQFYRFISNYKSSVEVGSTWGYSNLGAALLAKALARRAGMTYETLVRSRITGPLGMQSTMTNITPQMEARVAIGHDAALRPAPPWIAPAFTGEGELKSTADDLLTLLSAFMQGVKSPLGPAMATMLQTRRAGPGFTQTLGWWNVLATQGDDGIIVFGGQTWGYATTVAYDPEMQTGVVVLSNGTQDDGGLGWHLLRPAVVVKTAAVKNASDEKKRREVNLDPKLLDTYVGRYRVSTGPTAGEIVTVERDGDVLVLKSASTPPEGVRLHAESEQKFFIMDADLQIIFQLDDRARVINLIFHFAGNDTVAPRVQTSSVKE